MELALISPLLADLDHASLDLFTPDLKYPLTPLDYSTEPAPLQPFYGPAVVVPAAVAAPTLHPLNEQVFQRLCSPAAALHPLNEQVFQPAPLLQPMCEQSAATLQQWRVQRVEERIVENVGKIKVTLRKRGDENVLPSASGGNLLYQPFRYQLKHQLASGFFSAHTTVQSVLARVHIVDAENLDTQILKRGRPILSAGAELHAIVRQGAAEVSASDAEFSGELRVLFNDCSFHHSNRHFVLQVRYFLNAQMDTPFLVLVSPPFRVMARPPERRPPVSSLSSVSTSVLSSLSSSSSVSTLSSASTLSSLQLSASAGNPLVSVPFDGQQQQLVGQVMANGERVGRRRPASGENAHTKRVCRREMGAGGMPQFEQMFAHLMDHHFCKLSKQDQDRAKRTLLLQLVADLAK